MLGDFPGLVVLDEAHVDFSEQPCNATIFTPCSFTPKKQAPPTGKHSITF